MGLASPHIDDQSANRAGTTDARQDLLLAVQSYGKRSFTWAAVLATAIAGCLALSSYQRVYPSPIAHALVEGYTVIAGICVVYCLWVQYNVTRERRFLLSTVAFSGLSLGSLAQGFASLVPAAHLQLAGTRYAHGWHIVAAILLIMAACDTTICDAQTLRKAGKRTLTASMLLSLCLMTLPMVFDPRWLHLRQVLPNHLALSIRDFLAELMSPRSLDIAGMGGMSLALISHIRTYAEREDEYSKRVVPFLTMMVAANAGALASRADFDAVWWASHGLVICGLMIFLTELGIQFGSSYSDAQARIRHMEAVHYMSSRLTNTLDLRVVLLALVSDTASMLSAKFASVMLADDSGMTLTTEVTYGLPESPLRPREPQNVDGQGRPAFYSGHTARAFREKRICMVDDVFTDVEFMPWKVLARHDGYAVSVPLVYHDLALGVLNLFFEKHVSLNDEKIKLFQTLASSAAVAIVNAQLYDRTLTESEKGDASFSLRLAS